MGWGKYMEDDISRRNGTSRAQAEMRREAERRAREVAAAAIVTREPGEEPMNEKTEFTATTARPLPVLVLADVSGSMNKPDKIGALNHAIEEMLASFRSEDDSRAEIHVAVITFGKGGARTHQAMAPVSQVTWTPMAPDGNTPLGAAFDLAVTMLEDRAQIPSRAYRPTIILVSDGQPTDDWRAPLERLLQSERASKAGRFAMGIGADADLATLEAFLAIPDARVHRAHEARQIKQFFRWVTLTVAQRSRHARPDSVIAAPPIALEDIEF